MTVTRFYPYRTSPEGVQLEVVSADPAAASADDGSLRVTDVDADAVNLELELSVDESTYQRVLASDASPAEDTTLVVIARSTESRSRKAFPVDEAGVIHLTFKRSEWVGLVEVFGALVRRSSGSVSHGYAAHKGALLAWSETLVVRLDEPPDRTGENLPVKWIQFSERADLRANLQHLFAVDPGNPPELLLNSDVKELSSVLESKGTHGVKARIRDAVYMQIAHQVWTSLLSAALESLRGQLEESSMSAEDALEELVPWEAAVIRRWVSDLFPGQEKESLLEVLVEEVAGPNVSELYLVRIPRAVQRKIETYKSFEGLVKDSGLRTAIEGSQ